jgi:hypothetical protein
MLAGFEEMVLECRTERSRGQIREAIKCYESGAYRAAIVMSHMAVCFDLLDKLNALSAMGDAEAKNQITIFENYQTQLNQGNPQAISNLLGFERSLLEIFRTHFEFFGVNEYDDLVRLRDDRNRCAHPTFFRSEQPYNPSAELARLHIRNALSLVLMQEPRQGKAAIDELKQAILSQYFPDKVPDVAERLKALGIAKARDSLIRALIDELVFGVADKDHDFYKKISVYAAIDGVIELRKDIAASRTAMNVSKLHKSSIDDAIVAGSMIVLRNHDVAALIDDGAKSSIRSWLGKAKDPFIANVVRRGLKLDWLEQQAKARLAGLTSEQMSKSNPEMPDVMLQRAAELYCEAKNWDKANELAEQVAIPFSGKFGENHIRYIFEQAKKGSSDLIGSHGFREFIKKLYEENPLGKDKMDDLLKELDLEFYKP